MKFRVKIWKSGTGLILTIPQVFVKSEQIEKGDIVDIEMKKAEKQP